MGMASFEVIKESITELVYPDNNLIEEGDLSSFWQMCVIVLMKIALVFLCQKASFSQSKGFKDSIMETLIQGKYKLLLASSLLFNSLPF